MTGRCSYLESSEESCCWTWTCRRWSWRHPEGEVRLLSVGLNKESHLQSGGPLDVAWRGPDRVSTVRAGVVQTEEPGRHGPDGVTRGPQVTQRLPRSERLEKRFGKVPKGLKWSDNILHWLCPLSEVVTEVPPGAIGLVTGPGHKTGLYHSHHTLALSPGHTTSTQSTTITLSSRLSPLWNTKRNLVTHHLNITV